MYRVTCRSLDRSVLIYGTFFNALFSFGLISPFPLRDYFNCWSQLLSQIFQSLSFSYVQHARPNCNFESSVWCQQIYFMDKILLAVSLQCSNVGILQFQCLRRKVLLTVFLCCLRTVASILQLHAVKAVFLSEPQRGAAALLYEIQPVVHSLLPTCSLKVQYLYI